MNYTIYHTDNNVPPVTIEENTVDDTSFDVSLFGRIDLEYGQSLNEGMLHILERFACPQDSSSTFDNTFPDYSVNNGRLIFPTEGQLWYNSTAKLIYTWNGTMWTPLRIEGGVSGNFGQLMSGSQIPRPVNPHTGYVYAYNQCIWAVSPANIPAAFTYMRCTTDNIATVTMEYRVYGDTALSQGIANYIIVGISENTNLGSIAVTPIPPVSAAPSPTPAVTHTSTPSPVVSSTPAVTPTPTSTPSISITPSSGAAPSSTPAVTSTPSVTSTSTPTTTPPVPTPSPTPDPCTLCHSYGFHCCVTRNSFLPDRKIAGDIKVNDIMELADQITLEAATGKVTYSEPSLQPCVRIITKSNTSLVCSTTAPIPTTEGIISAPLVFGKYVAVKKDGESFWDIVTSVEPVGDLWVQHITVEDKCFWAGENSNAFILHHNIKCCYCGGFSGCSWVSPNCCIGDCENP